ncbi:MAG TPA: hypothetical protein VEW95_11505 [Candidatus Limnocylindrales bacterium]|nr:hypothetical protein [Candidatus Limnocylindrales bacterium]
MRRRLLGALVAIGIGIVTVACTEAPRPSEALGGACAGDLPARTSPTDYPVAVMHAGGDDLPPVIGEVEWLGGDEPVATVAPRAVHLGRFTVLQVQGVSEVSLRMTDGVAIAEWRVIAISDVSFRSGEAESGSEWSTGNEVSDEVCVPVEDGAWAIRAEITFADDAGRGTFFWRLNVSESPNG